MEAKFIQLIVWGDALMALDTDGKVWIMEEWDTEWRPFEYSRATR